MQAGYILNGYMIISKLNSTIFILKSRFHQYRRRYE